MTTALDRQRDFEGTDVRKPKAGPAALEYRKIWIDGVGPAWLVIDKGGRKHDSKGRFSKKSGVAKKWAGKNTFKGNVDNESDSPVVAKTVDQASSAVASVHKWPSMDDFQRRIRVVTLANSKKNGDFKRRRPPEDRDRIRVNRNGEKLGNTMVHEMGHALDYGSLGIQYQLGDHRRSASEDALKYAEMTLDRKELDANQFGEHNPMVRVMYAIEKSPEYQKLTHNADTLIEYEDDNGVPYEEEDKMAEYMIRPTELFARAYEQFIGTHTDNEEVRKQYEERRAITETVRGKIDDSIAYWYFEDPGGTIMKEMEGMMKDLGWAR